MQLYASPRAREPAGRGPARRLPLAGPRCARRCRTRSSPGRSRCSGRRLRPLAARALDEFSPDVVLVEHDWVAAWHRDLPDGLPRALTLQNLSWAYYETRAGAATGLQAAALRARGAALRALRPRAPRPLRPAARHVGDGPRGRGGGDEHAASRWCPTASTRRTLPGPDQGDRSRCSTRARSATRPTPRRSTGCCATCGRGVRAAMPSARSRSSARPAGERAAAGGRGRRADRLGRPDAPVVRARVGRARADALGRRHAPEGARRARERPRGGLDERGRRGDRRRATASTCCWPTAPTRSRTRCCGCSATPSCARGSAPGRGSWRRAL